MHDTNDRPDTSGADTYAIEANGLGKTYGTGADAVVAVDDLELAVRRGEVFGFLGPNGAGKSTTIDMLLGLSAPTEGSARVLGFDSQREAESIKRHIGVLPEGYGLYERLSGRRHLEFAIEWQDADDDPAAILERVGLDESDAERPVGEYSKGMAQRLAMGMALVGSPELLILDEPTSGLDPHGIRRMREVVRTEAERGATVFFSSHILEHVEAVCDRVGILHEGSLVAVDTVDDLRRTVGAGSELLIRTADPVDIDISDIAGVATAVTEGSFLRVVVTDTTAKATVVQRLLDHGVRILDLDSVQPSLEDVFTAYTTADESERSPDATADTQEVFVR